jgi:hypothetical protein
MARIQRVVAPATPKRGRKKKADREKRPDNQWQKNLKAWNRGKSGWCIPKKGSADHQIVKHWHTNVRGAVDDARAHITAQTPSKSYISPPPFRTPQSERYTPYRRMEEMRTPQSIDFDRYLEGYVE